MIDDVEYLFMYLLAIYLFSLERWLFKYSVHLSIGLFVFYIELHELFVYLGY